MSQESNSMVGRKRTRSYVSATSEEQMKKLRFGPSPATPELEIMFKYLEQFKVLNHQFDSLRSILEKYQIFDKTWGSMDNEAKPIAPNSTPNQT